MTNDHPQRWKCHECGHAFYDSDEWDVWYCSQCGSEMEVVPPEGYVAVSELEPLIEEWRALAEKAGPEEFEIAYSNAADELEDVIGDG